jgi:hypothetical protein
MIRLIKPTVYQRLLFGLYALGLLFAVDGSGMLSPVRSSSIRSWWCWRQSRDSGAGVVAGLWKPQRAFAGHGSARLRAFRSGASIVLFVLGLGLVAGVLGYMPGARLWVSCVLLGGVLALTLSVSVKILCGVAAFGFRMRPLRLLNLVGRHRGLLEKRAYRFLVWLAIVAWLIRVLDYVGLLHPALSLGKAVLAIRLERGSISISLEDVLAFGLTLWAAYLLSAFIRFVLEEDVYPRRKVARGRA